MISVNMVGSYKQSKGRDSSVGIATRYGMGGPRIECRWSEILCSHPDRPWGPPNLLHNRDMSRSRGLGCRGVALTTHPHLAPKLKKQ
jgi:hypothetical protein